MNPVKMFILKRIFKTKQVKNAIEWLKGKKTYISVVLYILTALLGFLNGDLSLNEFLQSLFGGGAASALRAGISKSQ